MDQVAEHKTIPDIKATPEYARFESVLAKVLTYRPEKKQPKPVKA